jgi:hypothetical protein
MAKRNPRNKGLQGNDLIKLKYNYLIDQGIPAKYARKFRKNSWDKIDQAIKLKSGGMLEKVSLPPKQQKIKTKGRREKKPKTKEIPDGYHWRKGYTRNGKWIPGSIVKNPTRKPREPISTGSEYPKMMIFWKDQTDEVDGSSITKSINQNKRKSINYLKTDINGSGSTPGYFDQAYGQIGKAEIEIAFNREEEEHYIRMYAGWTLIYNDIPQYKELLAVVASLGVYIYQPWQKKATANAIITTAQILNEKIGDKLQNDINV